MSKQSPEARAKRDAIERFFEELRLFLEQRRDP
jgi:hypothetical protein